MRLHLVALAIALASLVSLSVWRLLTAREAGVASLELRQSQREERSRSADHQVGIDHLSGVQATRPASPEGLLHELQGSLGGDGARISSVSAARGGAPQSLAFSALSFTLEGDYSHLKASIDELIAEHPDVVVEHLSMQRVASPADVKAQLVLRVIGLPLSASAD